MKTDCAKGAVRFLGLGILVTLMVGGVSWPGGNPPATGPETAKRFPPLSVPDGFKATLFACDPFIEYPSAIARGPETGSLFVAVDYMTGLGTEIIRKDEIRLIRDSDGDGYADKSVVYANDFNSIEGMTFQDGTVYVMHAPLLTALRDTNGDGKADERRDLLAGLGLPPEENPVRLHCANGLVMGHDGWLYLALGDHGCKVKRPEGDTLVYNGGGILRCRGDGTGLHLFASGLRNIYDVALDADLNVFVRDNENDGGTYMIRVCHSFFGADHGYPYHYYERPGEAMPPIADLGRGSSAGGLCYLETAFPPEYRGNLIFCEWGRSVVRYALNAEGSGFGPVKEIDFASGAANDPYGFKPTDVVVDYDGALFVADWADGQRPKRGRGRIYRITSGQGKKGPVVADRIEQLDSPSYLQRLQAQSALLRDDTGLTELEKAWKEIRLGDKARNHAVWILALREKEKALPRLFEIVQSDPAPAVRLQAVRAIADFAKPGDEKIAERLAGLAKGQRADVVREIVVALGRLHWSGTPAWLRANGSEMDPPMIHAVMQTLRRCGNWPTVVSLLDEPDSNPLRQAALMAVSEQYEAVVVEGLIERLKTDSKAVHRQEYADALTRVFKKPGPWEYWGYRPGPRPANPLAWDKTEAIAAALNRALQDSDLAVRYTILQRMQREKITARLETLSRWLEQDLAAEHVAAILPALAEHAKRHGILAAVVREKKHAEAIRLLALKLFVQGPENDAKPQLRHMIELLEDGPVLAEAMRQVAKYPELDPGPFLVKRMASPQPQVRIAFIEALTELNRRGPWELIERFLEDRDVHVQQAAVLALGKLNVKDSADKILKLAKSAELRAACLEALRSFKDARAIGLAAKSLEEPGTQQTALRYLGEVGGPEQAETVTKLALRNVSLEVLPPVITMLSKWSQREPKQVRELEHMIARIQGQSGTVLHWRLRGPVAREEVASLLKEFAAVRNDREDFSKWETVFGSGVESGLSLATAKIEPGADWLALSDVVLSDAREVEVLASGLGKFRVWLDGKLVHERKEAAAYQPDSDRFAVKLSEGVHRFLVAVEPTKNGAKFHLRFREKSSNADLEKWIQVALERKGNGGRGQEVFLDVNKSQCLKCHRLGTQGETIGPDLTGLGKRFSRVHIIESILEPSRTIAPSYETVLVQLKDGRVVSGTKIEETETVLTLGDKEGKKQAIAKNLIEERLVQAQSIMPDNLRMQWSEQEFVDLIAFLASQK
jgi:putative membrane-bound dehydrogenase-like protein